MLAGWQAALDLERSERKVVESIRAALGPGPNATTAVPLRLDDITPSPNKGDNDDQASSEHDSGRDDMAPDLTDLSQGHPQHPPWWLSDPIMAPLLQRASALGLPSEGGTVLLERAAVQHLLRSHPDASVRRAVYEQGVEPRKRALLRLKRALAEVR